ncbi:N-terminal kinase-like protein isoform X2 [Lingula anatina]|uniref:N-terminal kinase-like protein n=1 Tax=Lingula anatina TaxID=7574 RepID=A0A1S3K4B7_LINAN|nr:N-terminal kinase-like protein isoform X2 [Lingula anatina]|eukprot:XP_013417259.1 N-terminal kinase-like protein isoform X2 [Lingula anatina]
MWSLFSRDPTKDFPFEVGEKVLGLEEQSIWSLHNGKKKSTGELVSIFVFDVKSSSDSQVQLAKASFKRIKTLRHPNILTFMDGIETDKVIYVVTEHIVPLETYLRENTGDNSQNNLAIAWGLHQIAKGLSFLVNDCNLIHNNVSMVSVFVDKAGEWKLGGVDYMYPAEGPESLPPVKILPILEKYDPPEKADFSGPRKKKGEKWSTDSWGLGCLIWEIFNGQLPRTSSLKSTGKIPQNLVANYCELVGANPKSRPNPSKFIQDCRIKGGFMCNSFVDTMLFLEEIQIKDQTEKTQFFSKLPESLDLFPKEFCKHKILPQLLNAFEFGNAGSAVLTPLFKIGKLLDQEEYQKKIVPCVVKLFSSTDRATRVKMLQQLELFADFLYPPTVNEKIFPSVIQGFMDTNPVVREHTIKAMLYLASKLNYKNLNEELMKHFARLQSKDDQGGIRTNTTVCLGKIACHLDPQIRQKVLPSAFLRALKDPFGPSRQAGILAMAACHNFFSLKDSATRLLPALCVSAVDPEKGVRDQAFKAIKCFLGKLEKVSEHPEMEQELEKDLNAGGSAVTSGWTGWAVSGMSSLTSITSKIYKGRGKGNATVPATSQATPASASNPAASETAVRPASQDKPPTPAAPPSSHNNEPAEESGWNDEGWGDMDDFDEDVAVKENEDGDDWDNEEWGSLEDTSSVPNRQQDQTSGMRSGMSLSSAPKQQASAFDDWGVDDFAPIEDASVAPASSYNWGVQDTADDFFSTSLGVQSQKPKSHSSQSSGSRPSSTRSSVERQARSSPARTTPSSTPAKDSGWETGGGGGGWDDDGWGGDTWESIENTDNKADMARRKREERKLQKQKELQEKRAQRQGTGAMKLGAKKLGLD